MWIIIAQDGSGKEVARANLTDQPVSIGREKDRELVLPSSAVSRKHARIEFRAGRPFLFDEGSANGTVMEGKRVVAPVELANGSIIEITPFRLLVQGPPDEDEEEKTVMLRRPAAAAPRPSAPPLAAVPAAPRPAPPPAVPAASRPAPPPPPAVPAAPRPAPLPAAQVISSRPPLPPVWTPPPPPPPKAAPPPIETPRFIVPDIPAPAVPPSAAAGEWDSAASELDRQIQSMRSYRDQSDVTQGRVVQLDQDWGRLITNLQQVKLRLSGNPRLLVFNFGRDNRDVTIKMEDKRQRIGYRYFLISRLHPDNKFPGKDSVWLRETGREDMDFRDIKSAQSELLQRIAATLA